MRRRLLLGTTFLSLSLVACVSAETSITSTSRHLSVASTASTPSTSTTSSAPVSTTPASVDPVATTLPPIECRPDPFANDLSVVLADDYPGKQITAYVHDLRTGCSYELNPENRQITASVFKVMVLAGTLLEAQEDGREITEREMNMLVPMIRESANGPVRALWRSFGGSPWFREQGEVFGLHDTRVVGDDGSSWGGTRTSARDQVNLLRQVLLGQWGPLEPEYRAVAVDLMTSVVPSPSWGVTAGVPETWTVAQKNGFAGRTINSVGWVDEPGPSLGYVVAILTRGWSSHPAGIAAVERINSEIARVMTAPRS
ncbi:MAG: serine hydrolase [Acidimicrobiia bacterium]